MQNSIKSILVLLLASVSLAVFARGNKSVNESEVPVEVEQVVVNVDVFPNPVKDNFTISVENNSFDFALYGKNGKQLMSVCNCQESYKMDASLLSSGVYILNVIVDDNIYMKRIVIL